MVLWFYGFMVLWFSGFMVLWFYGFMVLSNGAEAAAQWVGEEVSAGGGCGQQDRVGDWYAKILVIIACSKTLENRIIIRFYRLDKFLPTFT
jgi:hypothetical protein